MKLVTSTPTATRTGLLALFFTITTCFILVPASAAELDYREAHVYVTAPSPAIAPNPVTSPLPAAITPTTQPLTDRGFLPLAPLEEPDEDIPTIMIDDRKPFQTI